MLKSTFKIFGKHKLVAALLLALGATTLASCEDIIEPNLTDQNLILLSPPNFNVVEQFEVQFIWEELEDADEYQLQIVHPDFSFIERYVMDTTISDHMFTVQLSPDDYQWRVRAKNGASETDWFTWNVTVDSISSLSNQTLVLLSPSNGFISNEVATTFEWDALAAADDYEFELRDNAGNLLLNPVITTYDTVNLTLSEADYEWAVRARNTTSNTLYYSRTLRVDTTAPGTPILSAPANGTSTANAPILFSWNRPADLGANPTTITDSLFIHADTFSTASFMYATSGTSATDSIGTGTWYWRVGSNDEANNLSDYSNWNTLIIQ